MDGFVHSKYPIEMFEAILMPSYDRPVHSSSTHSTTGEDNMQGGDGSHSRQKRVVPLIMAAGVVVSFASLIYDGINHLLASSHMSELTMELNNQGAQLSRVTKSVIRLQSSIAEIWSRITPLGVWAQIIGETALLRSAVQLVLQDSSRLVQGFQQLSFHRLSPRLVNSTDMSHSLSILRRRMSMAGYELLAQDLDDIYQCDTSHILFPNNTLMVFVHLPAIRTAAVMDLYSYIPMPLQLDPGGQGSVLLPVPEHRYIAITKDGTMTRVYTESAFGQCFKLSSYYRCPHSYTYDKRHTSTCLAALFRSDTAQIGALCKWDINPSQDYLAQVGKNEFLLYHHTDSEISRRCLGDPPTLETHRFQGTRRVRALPTCSFTTPSFLFDGELDLSMPASHLTTKPLNLSSLWKDVNGDHLLSVSLAEMAAHVLALGSKEDLTLQDIDALVDAHLVNTGFLYSTGTVSALVVLLAVVVLAYYARHHLRDQLVTRWARFRGRIPLDVQPSAPPAEPEEVEV